MKNIGEKIKELCEKLRWNNVCDQTCEDPYLHTHSPISIEERNCDLCIEPTKMSFVSELYGNSLEPIRVGDREGTEGLQKKYKCLIHGIRSTTELLKSWNIKEIDLITDNTVNKKPNS